MYTFFSESSKVESMLSVNDFYELCSRSLGLTRYTKDIGLDRQIKHVEIERPGLALTGFLKGYSFRRALVFGKVEMEFLRELSVKERKERLAAIFSPNIPFIVVSRGLHPLSQMKELAKLHNVAIFCSHLKTYQLLQKLNVILLEEFAPKMSCHGTLVESFGLGVLIQGDSSVGKSETALGLIERGYHRLVTDDVVIVKKKEGSYLVGTGPELTRHLLEIRGIGIINVAHLYGAVCISESSRIDIVVKLEEWDDDHFYDRVGLEEKFIDLLGIKVPFYVMPVKPGRDVVLLLETLVLNHRLKQMGYNSAKEFNKKLLATIEKRQKNPLHNLTSTVP